MYSNPTEVYTANIKRYRASASRLARQTRRISLLRLIVFLSAGLLVYWFATINSQAGIFSSLFAGIGFFLLLVKYHSRIISKRDLAGALTEINEKEIKVLDHEFRQYPSGTEFIDHTHRYASDLDLFGDGSLFQFVNRAATFPGKKKIADRLCEPIPDHDEILRNQQAIAELTHLINFRQKFGAIGQVYKEELGDEKKIRDWAGEKPLFGNLLYLVSVIIVPLLTLLMIFFLSTGKITVQLFFLWLVIPWGIAGFSASKTNRRHQMVSKTSDMLEKYANLLYEVETMNFQSEKLNKLQEALSMKDLPAGKCIKTLRAILTALDNRLNFVSWAVLNGLLLWDILQMIRLEKWQQLYKDKVNDWFDVIVELDVLISFGNYGFNHPLAVYPVISEEKLAITAKELGHPLISEKERVNNDFEIRQGEFMIITGANMAGKSTYLRTIGVNLILAMCGAPVIAAEFYFKPVDLCTSIRTTDSLLKNESYFYAELKRLRMIIEVLRSGKEIFIILDEILKGTNSKDKHKGSEALLKQFVSLNATGIVATHDVSLGFLADAFPDHIKNRCFEVDIHGNELSFDYKLRDGISKNMNATLLMKKMGITI